jgi:hypothetical protein
MDQSDPPPPRKAGRAAALIILVIAVIIAIIFIGRNVWHGEELRDNQAAGNNVAGNYQGQSNY